MISWLFSELAFCLMKTTDDAHRVLAAESINLAVKKKKGLVTIAEHLGTSKAQRVGAPPCGEQLLLTAAFH